MNKLGIIIGLLIGLGLFGAYNVKTKAKLKSNQEVSATQFVTKIEELGYYKYTDKKNIDSLKNQLIKNYDPTNELVSIWDDQTGVPLDYRYYWCDGETVFELGGFTEL